MGANEQHHHDSAVHLHLINFPHRTFRKLIKIVLWHFLEAQCIWPDCIYLIELNIVSVKVTCINQNAAFLSVTDLSRMVGNIAWQRKKRYKQRIVPVCSFEKYPCPPQRTIVMSRYEANRQFSDG